MSIQINDIHIIDDKKLYVKSSSRLYEFHIYKSPLNLYLKKDRLTFIHGWLENRKNRAYLYLLFDEQLSFELKGEVINKFNVSASLNKIPIKDLIMEKLLWKIRL